MTTYLIAYCLSAIRAWQPLNAPEMCMGDNFLQAVRFLGNVKTMHESFVNKEMTVDITNKDLHFLETEPLLINYGVVMQTFNMDDAVGI